MMKFLKQNPLLLILLLAAHLLVAYLFLFGQLRGDIAFKNNVRKKLISGVIEAKLIDTNNHMADYMKFTNGNKQSKGLIFKEEYPLFRVGDSLRKEKNSLILYVFRNDSLIMRFNYDEKIDSIFENKWEGKVKRLFE